MEILSHSEVGGAIENLIDTSIEDLLLVSPYFNPSARMADAIRRAQLRGVNVRLLLRGGDDKTKQEMSSADIAACGCAVRFLTRLHAKIYVSEQSAILTSMNLLGASATDSYESGARYRKAQFPNEYGLVRHQAELLVNLADEQAAVEIARTSSGRAAKISAPQTARAPKEPKQGKPRALTGHCLRCAVSIRQDMSKPLCPACYKTWSEYEDREYREKFCHICGEERATSMQKPLCKKCFQAMA